MGSIHNSFFSLMLSIIALILPIHTAMAAEKSPTPGVSIDVAPEAFPAARELSEKLAEVEAGSQTLRGKIVALQDTLAARLGGVSELNIEAKIVNSDDSRPPMGFVELEALLNDISLVRYDHPPASGRTFALPLYTGPIPAGTYTLTVRAIVGVMLHGWPHAYLQGRWSVEKTFPITAAKGGSPNKFQVVFQPGDSEPTMQLVGSSQ